MFSHHTQPPTGPRRRLGQAAHKGRREGQRRREGDGLDADGLVHGVGFAQDGRGEAGVLDLLKTGPIHIPHSTLRYVSQALSRRLDEAEREGHGHIHGQPEGERGHLREHQHAVKDCADHCAYRSCRLATVPLDVVNVHIYEVSDEEVKEAGSLVPW